MRALWATKWTQMPLGVAHDIGIEFKTDVAQIALLSYYIRENCELEDFERFCKEEKKLQDSYPDSVKNFLVESCSS